jgi:hypothetical protein
MNIQALFAALKRRGLSLSWKFRWTGYKVPSAQEKPSYKPNKQIKPEIK